MDLLLQKSVCSLFYLFHVNVSERSSNLPDGTVLNIIELGEEEMDFCEIILGSEVKTVSVRNIAGTSRTVRTATVGVQDLRSESPSTSVQSDVPCHLVWSELFHTFASP
jgi:hypothetical protein